MTRSLKKPVGVCLLTLTSLLTLAIAQAQTRDASGGSPNVVTEIVVSNSNVDVGEQFVFKDYNLHISGLPADTWLAHVCNVCLNSGTDYKSAPATGSQRALQEFSNNISTKSHQ